MPLVGAGQLAKAVRDKQISPHELVEESLRRIDAANSTLNAVVRMRAEEALAEADSLDESRRTGPLAGLPLLVKDLSDVAGMPTTYGSSPYADAAPATADATAVARLRAAGAIVVGKTNTPAFGWTAFTDNMVFGATRNPWNPQRSPGRSSGGSAAALAAGLAPLATTTDGGGSVRIPASMCGLVGYKPTLGVVGRDTAPPWLTFSTAGATNTNLTDVLLEMSVMAGPTATDINALPPGAVTIQPQKPSRVFAVRTLRSDVDPAIESAFDATLGALENAGLPVERIANPLDPGAPRAWFLIGAAEVAQALASWMDRWDEFERGLARMLYAGTTVSIDDYVAAQRLRYAVAGQLETLLGDDAVLVTPTCNCTSWPAEGPLPTAAGEVTDDPMIPVNTVELNFTGHPGVSVPIGVSPEGVPIGMQIVAPRFGDRYALGLAAMLGDIRPWPEIAPGYEPFGIA
ncbi:amidase [Mycobacterium hubeiense]|uniref:amidase n=1 Tax=Mycobacterium hubeiense TaxID=1867256 RepID=UPI000C7EECF2|nr:amidase [Mycobacterium sp. QGD 101]